MHGQETLRLPWLSRRYAGTPIGLLRRRLRPVLPGEGLPLVLNRTGLSLVGAGAWRCCMNTLRGWGGVACTSLDPPQEPHYRDEVEGPSHV